MSKTDGNKKLNLLDSSMLIMRLHDRLGGFFIVSSGIARMCRPRLVADDLGGYRRHDAFGRAELR